ncbi:MAG TPA: TIGR02996 domain-containing protein [Kofleriaceae bacterium]|nr:TIGR02996 domain-containing protein [Kofleriaceae bacterium]
MHPYQCPRCHGEQVHDGRSESGGGALLELSCLACGLTESRRSDAADFAAWQARWLTPVPPGSPEAHLAAVTAAPRDDAPRLAYADLLAPARPERAELIRLQIARGSGPPTSRERELLRRHGAEWARPLDPFARAVTRPRPDPGWAFDRGFVAFLRTDADVVLGLGERLFRMAPIEHLDLVGAPDVRPVLGSPLLGHLRSLGLPGCALDDAAAIALAANPALAGLRWLDLRDNQIRDRGMAALADSPTIRAIPIVLLGGNPRDPSEQHSLDWDGSVADSWLPSLGEELERAHGRIEWLHVPPSGRRPDRYRA